jgi:hypothetical protein
MSEVCPGDESLSADWLQIERKQLPPRVTARRVALWLLLSTVAFFAVLGFINAPVWQQ